MKLRSDRRYLYESIDGGLQNDEGDYIPQDFSAWLKIPWEAVELKETSRCSPPGNGLASRKRLHYFDPARCPALQHQ